jgi:hypothetical protein
MFAPDTHMFRENIRLVTCVPLIGCYRLVSRGIAYEPLVQAGSEVAPYQQPHYLLTRNSDSGNLS